MSLSSALTAPVPAIVTALVLSCSPAAVAAEASKGTRGITVRERLPDPKSAAPVTAPPSAGQQAPAQTSSPTVARPVAPPTDRAPSASGAAGEAPGRQDGQTSVSTPAVPVAPQPDSPVETALPGNAGRPANVGNPGGVIMGPGNVQVSTNNLAKLRLDLNGGGTFKAGDKLVLKVTSQKPGYLVIMDIAADGRITQIYPNVISLVAEGKKAGEANYLKPGGSVLVPDPDSPLTNFDFVAAPPFGGGLLVAMLSDQPVQIVDLPDAPPTAQKLEYVQQATRSLKITPAGGGPLLDPKWSFDAKAYTIAE